MIRVYINNEHAIDFETQEQFDDWYQSLDSSDIFENDIEVYYEED